MKLGVSHDKEGHIVTLFDMEKLHGEKGSLKYVPGKDEKHHVIELPKEFESEPFENLPKLLRVNTSGPRPRLERKA